ncbi:MAG: ATP-binding cassette domain-containing protein [Synergistaceae bacterium]|jgi:peptide/nickel transport system ATP-binding protein|nr:ATP-binding cassette domain-containing protein [Synergistaceae bacterium]
MTDAVLEVKNLSLQFRGRYRFLRGRPPSVKALDSVSLSLGRGDTLAVIGESGSGKTSLLRAVMGLLPPHDGDIELWGKSVRSMSAGERSETRRRCGYVLQDPYSSLPPTMSVMDAVMEPWNIVHHGRGKREEGLARARSLLFEMKLPEDLWASRVRYSLSGGQRQRVAIARALILEPEMLLCDEPTAMQDISTRGEVIEVLQRRVGAGMALMLVTHDLFLARRAAARGIVLNRGIIVDKSDTEVLLRNPSHEYTRALVAALPRI